MKQQPPLEWDTKAWLSDPAVSRLTPSARGIWKDLLDAMHEANHSGQITGTPEELARVGRCTVVQFEAALIEIQTHKVADVMNRNGKITLINRRMKREFKAKQLNTERQRKFRGKELSNAATEDGRVLDENSKTKKINPIHATPDDPPVPPELRNPVFIAHWNDWLKNRSELRKHVTKRGAKMQLQKCVVWGVAASIESIRQSIENGWQGLFEVRGHSLFSGQPAIGYQPPASDPEFYCPSCMKGRLARHTENADTVRACINCHQPVIPWADRPILDSKAEPF